MARRYGTGFTNASRGKPGVEVLDGMLTNTMYGPCEAVLGEVWCPCILYSATPEARLENLFTNVGLCICGHDYSWHHAIRDEKLKL